MAQEKQYGLIIPKKDKKPGAKVTASKPKNVFGEESSDEDDNAVDWLKKSLKERSHGSMQQKESMKVMKQALKDDPSVYQYDELYDDMEKKKEEVKLLKKGDRSAKYIDGLLKATKQRTLEDELRKEREAQKEREKEGDMFQDKEAFVTSAYKKKMEELRKMQDEQAYHDAVDDVTDISKQKDMSGFYRYLYREKMKEEPIEEPKPPAVPEDKEDDKIKNSPDTIQKEDKPDEQKTETQIKKEPEEETHDKTEKSEKEHHHRIKEDHRRRRRSDSYDNKEKRSRYDDSPSNRDRRNRDRSSSRDRQHRSNNDRNDRRRQDRHHRRSRSRSRSRDRHHRESGGGGRHRSRTPERRHRNRREDEKPIKTERPHKDSESRASPDKDSSKVKIIQKENWYDFDVEIEQKVKSDFYAKRTVGKAFEDALQRYLERKNTKQVITYK